MFLFLLFIIIILAFYILELLRLTNIIRLFCLFTICVQLCILIILMLVPDPIKAAFYMHSFLSELFAVVPVEAVEVTKDPILDKLENLADILSQGFRHVTNGVRDVNVSLGVLDNKLADIYVDLEVANVFHENNLAQRQFFQHKQLQSLDNLSYAVNNPKFANVFSSIDKNLYSLPSVLGELKNANVLLKQANNLHAQGFSDILTNAGGSAKEMSKMFDSFVSQYNDSHKQTLEAVKAYEAAATAEKAKMVEAHQAELVEVQTKAREVMNQQAAEALQDKERMVEELQKIRDRESLGSKTIQTSGYTSETTGDREIATTAVAGAGLYAAARFLFKLVFHF